MEQDNYQGVTSMPLLKRAQMNELIMDYLVHEGFKEAAERFSQEAGILPEADRNKEWPAGQLETPEMIDKRREVRNLIENGDILQAQSLINLYYPELLDTHRDLYFKLQQQHMIELIRQQKISELLAFIHDRLIVKELKNLTEMEKTLALLAYEQPEKSHYGELLQMSHRLELAYDINEIILRETTGGTEHDKPRLVTLLKFLYWTQNELEKKKILFPKMTDLYKGTVTHQEQYLMCQLQEHDD